MLVGRQEELLQIEGLVRGALDGRSAVLVMTGEAGIGKTALLGHASAVAPDTEVLKIVGTELERDLPFSGLTQCFTRFAEEIAGLPEPQQEALGTALALRSGESGDRLAVGVAVHGLMTRLADRAAYGLVVDDAHLVDPASAEAVAFACRRLLADPVFVLVAMRSGPESHASPFLRAGLPTLEVPRLRAADTAQLARQQVPDAAPGTWAAIARSAGGNPLAVVTAARDPSALESPTPVDLWMPVPQRVQSWFGGRVRALSDDAARLLVMVAVADGDLQAVAPAAGLHRLPVDVLLVEAERAGLVELEPGQVRFVHPLARAAVYASATPHWRRDCHRAIGNVLAVSDPERRTWHLAESAVEPDAAIAADLAALAHRSIARGGHVEAAAAFGRAALLATSHASRVDFQLSAAEAAWRGGDGDRTLALLDDVPATDAPLVRARGLALRADVDLRRGRPGAGRDALMDAADLARECDASLAARLLADSIFGSMFDGNASRALAASDRLRAVLDDADDRARAMGTLATAMAKAVAGLPAHREFAAGVELMSQLAPEDVPPRWSMTVALWSREKGAGRRLLQSAIEDGRARSAVSSLPGLLFLIARDGATTDRWEAAASDYQESIDLARETRQTTDLALSLAGLAWLRARQGDAEACATLARETRELCAEHPVHLAEMWGLHAEAEQALVAGEGEEAVTRFTDLAHRAAEIEVTDPDTLPQPDLVEALVRVGREDEAADVAELYLAAARRKDLPWSLARAHRACGLVADPDALDEVFGEALGQHARSVDDFETARTRLAYGSRLRRCRRRVDSRTELREAMAVFDRLGARPWAELAARELEATGETAARAGTPRYRLLTAREMQLALYLAAGHTTKQTAAAFFVSPKTVEYHLRQVYTKLDISSRAELAERLQDLLD